MAATVIKQSMPGYIDRHGAGADALNKEIDAMRMRYNMMPLLNGQWFRTATPRGGTYQESTYSDLLPLPRQNEDSERIPIAEPYRGFKKQFTTTEYRLGTQVERRYTEEQLFPIAKRQAGGLMAAGRRLLEYAMADILNNLTATTSAYVGADGVAIASTGHPHERYATGTWSNLDSTSAALDYWSFVTARTNMRQRTDEYGYPMPIIAKQIVVPEDIEDKARRLFSSELVPGGALNDKNVWQGSVEIVVNDYLTDTNAWILFGDIPKEYAGLLYMPEVEPNIAPMEGADKSTDIIWGERLRMIFAVGGTVEKNLQYNQGA